MSQPHPDKPPHPEATTRTRLSQQALARATTLLHEQLAELGGRRVTQRDHALATLGINVGILAAFSVFEEVFDQMLLTLELGDPTPEDH